MDARELCVAARGENLAEINQFVEEYAGMLRFSERSVKWLLVACDEIFSNIVKYAYGGREGDVTVRAETLENGDIQLTFLDGGKRFNPLLAESVDTSLPLDERPDGKMGLAIVKEIMNTVDYAYSDGKNILSVTQEREAK